MVIIERSTALHRTVLDVFEALRQTPRMPDLSLSEVAEVFAAALVCTARAPFALIATAPLDTAVSKSYKAGSPLVRRVLC